MRDRPIRESRRGLLLPRDILHRRSDNQECCERETQEKEECTGVSVHKRVPKKRPYAVGDPARKLSDNALGFIRIA